MPTEYTITSSGLKTADAVIANRPARLHSIALNPAAAASTIIVYDNASAATGTVLLKLVAPASGASVVWENDVGIEASRGLYMAITGAAADAVVGYSLL